MRVDELTDAILAEAVRAQPTDELDSHDVILWITRNRPRQYAADLNRGLRDDDGDPFVNLHTAIGRRLAALPHVVRQQHRKVVSRNIRDEETRAISGVE